MSWVVLLCAWLLLSGCAPKEDTVVLLKSLDGTDGKVVVDSATEAHVLTAPRETVDLAGTTMSTRISTAAEVETTFGAVLPRPVPERSYRILFETGEQGLPLEADAMIAALLTDVAARAPAEVVITGHTDTVGSIESNDRISRNRAVAVREALIARGLKAALLRAVGRGERELRIPTADDVAEEGNRRVEILIR